MKRRTPKAERLGDIVMEQNGRALLMRNVRRPEDQEAFLEHSRHLHRELQRRIAGVVSELETELWKYDPFDVLTNLGIINLFQDPETYKEYEARGAQAYVEYAALLYLKRPYPHGLERPPLGRDQLEPIDRLVRDIFQLTVLYYLTEDKPSGKPDPLVHARYGAIVYGLFVRSPGYPHHVVELLRRLFTPLAGTLEDVVGFDIEDALALTEGVDRLLNGRLKQRRAEARETETELRRATALYARSGAVRHPWPREVLASISAMKPRHARSATRSVAFAYLFSAIGETLTFGAPDLADEAGVPLGKASAFLNLLSLQFGAVPGDFSEPTPTHQLGVRPFMRDGDRYFCPVLPLVVWALRPAFEDAVKAHGAHWERYQRTRSRCLNHCTLEFLRNVLRHGEFHSNLAYGEGDEASELDGLVIFDSRVFLIECKAGVLTQPARRGAPPRLLSDLKKLVAEAHDQAIRARRYIESCPTVGFRTEDGATLTLERGTIKEFFLVTVTLDDLSPHTSSLHETAQLGLFHPGDLPWAVQLLDLRVISEMIEFPSQFVHFLRRRLELNEMKKVTAGDELDWLGHYVAEGLFFEGLIPNEVDRVTLMTYTTGLDDYYLHEQGQRKAPATKPRQKMPDRMRAMIQEMETNRRPGRSDIAIALLDLDTEARRVLARNFDKLRRRAEKRGTLQQLTMVFKGLRGLTVMASSQESAQSLYAQLTAYCTLQKYAARQPEWVGLMTHTRMAGLLHGALVLHEPWQHDPELEELVKLHPSADKFLTP